MNEHNLKSDRGFMALTAVAVLASGALAFALATMSAAAFYADQVMKKELRAQANLNAEACLDTAKLMAVKDYFVSGSIQIQDFNCTARFINDFLGHVSISVTANISGVEESDSGSLTLSG